MGGLQRTGSTALQVGEIGREAAAHAYWLALAPPLYSGVGADIVMKSITLIDPWAERGFECRLITTLDNNFRGSVIGFANSHGPDSEGYMRRSSACRMVGRTRGKRTLLKLFYFLSVAG